MKSLAKALSYDEASVINSLLNESSWVLYMKGCRTDVLKSIEETDKYQKRGWMGDTLKLYTQEVWNSSKVCNKFARTPIPPTVVY